MNRLSEPNWLRRIRILTTVFMAGLVISGLTAIPLRWEVGMLSDPVGMGAGDSPREHAAEPDWVRRVAVALSDTAEQHPFLFYGTDWLAFGHLVIALAFVGAWRDPVRNRWLFDFGLIACALVIPWALVFGAWRGIPFWWRCIDGAFGVVGAVPLWLCWRWVARLAHPGRAQPGVGPG